MQFPMLDRRGDLIPQLLKLVDDVLAKDGRKPQELHVSARVFGDVKRALQRMPAAERREIDSIAPPPSPLENPERIVVLQLRGVPLYQQDLPDWIVVPIVPTPETRTGVLGLDQRLW